MIRSLEDGLLLLEDRLALCIIQRCTLFKNWLERDQEEWNSGEVESRGRDARHSWIVSPHCDSSSHFPFSFPARYPTNWWFGYLGYFFFPHGSLLDTAVWTKPLWTLVLKLCISVTQVVKKAHSCTPAPKDCAGSVSEAWACALWHRCSASHTISDAQEQPVMELRGHEPGSVASARCWVPASPSPWGQTPEQSKSARVIATSTLCSLPETYLRNLEEKLTQNKLILKEELRTLLHLCTSRDDVELAKHVIYRWGTSLEYCQPFLFPLSPFPEQSHTPGRFQLSPLHWQLPGLLSRCLPWAPHV